MLRHQSRVPPAARATRAVACRAPMRRGRTALLPHRQRPPETRAIGAQGGDRSILPGRPHPPSGREGKNRARYARLPCRAERGKERRTRLAEQTSVNVARRSTRAAGVVRLPAAPCRSTQQVRASVRPVYSLKCRNRLAALPAQYAPLRGCYGSPGGLAEPLSEHFVVAEVFVEPVDRELPVDPERRRAARPRPVRTPCCSSPRRGRSSRPPVGSCS